MIFKLLFRSTLTFAFLLLFFPFSMSSSQAANLAPNQDSLLAKHLSPHPTWVQAQHYASDYSLNRTQAVQYLLLDNQVNILASDPIYYSRMVSRVLNLEGVKEISEIKIRFNPAFQQLKLHRFSIQRAGQVADLAERANIKVLQQEDRLQDSIQDGVLTALITFKDVRVGDVVDYSYSLVGTNPIFGKRRFGSEGLSWSVEIDKRHFSVLSDNGALPFKSHRSDARMNKTKTSTGYRYELTLQHTAAVTAEGNYPPGVTPYAWIEYSEYESWEAVETWARSLYDFAHYDTTKLQDIIKGLVDTSQVGVAFKQSYVEQAMRFVQDEIRYLGLEFGINAFLPRSPQKVLEQRYGDCKDKSVLLTSLLSAKGIQSYPALVSSKSRSAIANRLPSPGAFDHVISLVKLNDKDYWIDGTRNYQRGGLEHYGQSDYGYALVVGGNGPALTRMYPKEPPRAKVTIEEMILPSANEKAANYQIITRYRGTLAEYHRYRKAANSLNILQKNILNYYEQFHKGIRALKPLEIQDDESLNQLTYIENYEIPNYWQLNGSQYSNLVVLAGIAEHVQLPQESNRDLPYFVGGLIDLDLSLSLQYPEDVIANIEPFYQTVSHPTFDFSRKQRFDGRTYFFQAQYRRLAREVSPEVFTDYKSKLTPLNRDWNFTLTTRQAVVFPGVDDVLKLKRALEQLANQ